jgi:hypothetical protein
MVRSEYDKNYYAKNRDRLLKQQTEYYYRKKKENPVHVLFIRLRSRAKEKGLAFNIDESDIIIPRKCPILGIPLKFHRNGHRANTPSVDRINSKKGYVKGNIAIISQKANAAKSDLTKQQIKRLWEYVSN